MYQVFQTTQDLPPNTKHEKLDVILKIPLSGKNDLKRINGILLIYSVLCPYINEPFTTTICQATNFIVTSATNFVIATIKIFFYFKFCLCHQFYTLTTNLPAHQLVFPIYNNRNRERFINIDHASQSAQLWPVPVTCICNKIEKQFSTVLIHGCSKVFTHKNFMEKP